MTSLLTFVAMAYDKMPLFECPQVGLNIYNTQDL